jgi:hypothetical protein
MAVLITQTVTTSGLTPAYQAASSGGDQWEPSSTTFLAFKNGSGAAITVTVATTATAYGQPISNVAISVPASSEVFAGPFDPGMVQQPGSSLANLSYSSTTSLTVAAINCPAE